MMWVLIVSICMSIGGVPACGSDIHPVAMQTFAKCEDAAVLTHDQIRAAAEANGVTVLSLDTHCVTTASLPISAEGGE
ncbi:hypothetical protein PL336_07125 [Sulfitobacter faviae]|uniref:Uncharacterized protein n=1 Tax=Sulfitobacter faviae TaxID=1775881 RepID=A0AAX3LSN7_9RHOB|nr:hypothetical protein [Sulfitobacter faviae]WCE71595.1 hypothetical protein PL336_07125 [Sulfitobacter faviae]